MDKKHNQKPQKNWREKILFKSMEIFSEFFFR